MKKAEEFRAGNAIKIGNDLFIVLKATYNKGARNASSMKLKMKNLETGNSSETVYRADDKLENVMLDHRKMQYLYGTNGSYTVMDQENFEQIDLNADLLGDAVNFLLEQMVIDVVMFGEKPVGVELPVNVDMTITYTEPAVQGNTGGKVLKEATVETGFKVQVPLYCNIGDRIRLDSRTGEFVSRA
ncbi:MAG: elongation factor P [Chitinispirillaceae bacterium]|jgi:elongation factor P|nr:elongation factor P [Chitinispirillaceae bacterium]